MQVKVDGKLQDVISRQQLEDEIRKLQQIIEEEKKAYYDNKPKEPEEPKYPEGAHKFLNANNPEIKQYTVDKAAYDLRLEKYVDDLTRYDSNEGKPYKEAMKALEGKKSLLKAQSDLRNYIFDPKEADPKKGEYSDDVRNKILIAMGQDNFKKAVPLMKPGVIEKIEQIELHLIHCRAERDKGNQIEKHQAKIDVLKGALKFLQDEITDADLFKIIQKNPKYKESTFRSKTDRLIKEVNEVVHSANPNIKILMELDAHMRSMVGKKEEKYVDKLAVMSIAREVVLGTKTVEDLAKAKIANPHYKDALFNRSKTDALLNEAIKLVENFPNSQARSEIPVEQSSNSRLPLSVRLESVPGDQELRNKSEERSEAVPEYPDLTPRVR